MPDNNWLSEEDEYGDAVQCSICGNFASLNSEDVCDDCEIKAEDMAQEAAAYFGDSVMYQDGDAYGVQHINEFGTCDICDNYTWLTHQTALSKICNGCADDM